MNTTRSSISFESAGTRCAATYFRPKDVEGLPPCVVMGHGFTGTKDQLAAYAERFAGAGIAALTFDYRHFGESGGMPRQIINIKEQLEDWRAAIALARGARGIAGRKVALWGSSLSGGHVLKLGAEVNWISAIVAQVPAVDKSSRAMSKNIAIKRDREGASLPALIATSIKVLAAGIYDEVRNKLGLSPFYIPAFGVPGQAAAFTEPGSLRHASYFAAAGPTWRNVFAPRFIFGVPRYKQGLAEQISVPLLVCVADYDTEADPDLAKGIAKKAPLGELKTYPVSHFDVYYPETFERMVADQSEFLQRHLLLADD